ncbi:hypothetical protein NEOLEDRAFT_1176314 [Neolentinus lepideus HHB14362 ss-1]|uniref:RRM domain-containing protein n=1 Tax=Neolentinus lepideus HHB14362 ss-1 TaxID=1314782 RepID=A0A165UHL1_9AGAM|nr:hypothetical protein NEOLEDRAFT_1176314 [Neolentinus lepideus HHB14362 ss-1]
MHSSTGSPSPTCAHDNRASISTPPPQSSISPAFANSSVPNSPAPAHSEHASEWTRRDGGSMDTMSLRDDTSLVGLGFSDGTAAPDDSEANVIGAIISLYSSSSPTLTAVASPAVSVSPTPTAYASALPSPSFGSSTFRGAETLSINTADAITHSSSLESAPSSSLESTPSSLSASPTFTTVASATVSPATKFVLAPAATSPPVNSTSSVVASPAIAASSGATPSSVALSAITLPAITSPAIATMSGPLAANPISSLQNFTSPEQTSLPDENAGVSDSLSSAFASGQVDVSSSLTPAQAGMTASLASSGQATVSGSPTPHATATTPPNPNVGVAKGNTLDSGGLMLKTPVELLDSKSPATSEKIYSPPTSVQPAASAVSSVSSESFVFSPASYEFSQLSNAAQDTSSTLSAASSALSATSSTASGQSFKTPNVYINGLPPNFPEEQLFNMTKEFGPVVSVRTFTRHVSERPTGYGFVLFETLEGAEKCIEALRKYRNLHPSFSKQIHKIPGTLYSNVDTTQCAVAGAGDGSGGAGVGVDENSFKVRMEKLKDTTSTNLYIEGLPLSIDEPTLAALVSPYAIKSSRFFQTKLSHPPRIIAFLRLETRTACEEIIERLHGRMVRGWNDPGCRISVRFADSNEQRELRKKERAKREGGDGSPNRLTMAQAALLNLRGSEMKSRAGGLDLGEHTMRVQGLGHRAASAQGLSQHAMATQSLNQHSMAGQSLAQQSMAAQYQQQRDMQLLLDSLKNGGMGLDGMGMAGLGYPAANLIPGSVDVNTLLAAQELNNWNGSGSTQAGVGGLTPAEQLLIQAHMQARARLGDQGVLGSSPSLPLAGLPQAAMSRSVSQGYRGYANNIASPNLHGYSQLGSPAVGVLPGMPEEEINAVPSVLSQRSQTQGQARGQSHRGNERGFGAVRSTVDLDLDNITYGHHGTVRRGSTTNDPILAQRQASAAQGLQGRAQSSSHHMRATTLPASYAANHRSGGTFDAGKGALASAATRANNLKIDSVASNAGSSTAEKDQSPLVSPALTYASRTPSSTSFSPATPYFNAGFEGYEGVGVSVGAGDHVPAGLGLSMINGAGNGKGKGRAVSHS